MFDSFWPVFIYTLITTHITIAFVTIYLHRCQAHKSLKVSPGFDKAARLWLWFFTSQITTEWVSVHRKHHAKCETEQDPHSPQIYGLKKVLFQGLMLYRKEIKNQETIKRYSIGCPNDKLEQFLFKYKNTGLVILFLLNIALFSYWGILAYLIQLAWIPFWAAGVVNGVGHYWGYRNFESNDASTNISPWGIIIGGEELHNNHHAYPTSAKLSMRKWEFDIGWLYISILKKFNLVSDVKVSSIPGYEKDFVSTFLSNQYYYKKILNKSTAFEVNKQIKDTYLNHKEKFTLSLAKLKKVFTKSAQYLSETEKFNLKNLLSLNSKLEYLYNLKQHLQTIFENKRLSYEEAKKELIAWKNSYFNTKELQLFFDRTQMNLLLK